MAFADFMNKIRHLDNLVAKWMMRHFYFLFFQIVLIGIFLVWFVNLFKVINTSVLPHESNLMEELLKTQSINTTLITFLMLLNSFWILYIFNGMMRMHNSLKDMSYHLSRLRRNNVS